MQEFCDKRLAGQATGLILAVNDSHGPGVFVLSLDTELAWGAVHRGGYAGREDDFARTRYVVDELVGLLEKYEIRATWAIVGHLFLRGCKPENGVKHPEIVRPQYPGFRGDWFDRDPCSNALEEPYWYGPDIVEKIRACRVGQEIGSHNFSHVVVGTRGCTAECFASELVAAKRAAAEWGEELRSFVFPRNAVGHLDVLYSHGYRAYRGLSQDWTSRLPAPAQRVGRLVDAFLPFAAPTSRPVYESGMWNIPASYNYLHRTGWGRLVPVRVRVRKSIGSLRSAARRRTVFHLWTHPFNIASDPRGLLRGLELIFQEVRALRESGLLANSTMGELAERLDTESEFAGKATQDSLLP